MNDLYESRERLEKAQESYDDALKELEKARRKHEENLDYVKERYRYRYDRPIWIAPLWDERRKWKSISQTYTSNNTFVY